MTNENIERIIDALNINEINDRIFRASLSEVVDYARVWLDEPKGKTRIEGDYDFFFIKDKATGFYVAAVLDMQNDLHLFVKKAFLGKDYLPKAMKEVIFPYLYQKGRKVQCVTFENIRVANYCVRKLGFILTGDLSAEKDLSAFAKLPEIKLTPLSL